MPTYDIAILGGGPGGYVAALHAAVKGAEVALIERDRVGGICVTVGCIPSKALLDSSHAYWLTTHGEDHGIHVDGARFELPKAVAHKDRVVAQLVSGVEALLKGRKADLIKGEGTFVSPTQLRVGDQTVDAKALIVATGSKVGTPPIKGLAEAKPLDNVGALALTEIPKRLIVIGGGAIGLELGTFFSEIGSQVTVLEMLPQPIAYADPELVRLLVRALEQRGVKVRTNAKVTEVKRTGPSVAVSAEVDGKQESFEGEHVLIGAGRIANLSGVEQAGFTTNRLGITVDDRMRTNIPGVWAIGDCIGDPRAPKLAHVASAQGEVEGLTKIVTAGKDQRIVGVHIVGPQASELIAEATLAMRLEATVEDVIATIHAHPTLAETFREAAL